MKRNPEVWALVDERPGTGNQCKGVAMALKIPFVEKKLSWSQLAFLPNFLIGTSLIGLKKMSKAAITAPWPDVVIASGRRAGIIARYIKRKNPRKCSLVQIMYPGYSAIDDFDLVAIPNHDAGIPEDNNIFRFMGTPHGIDRDQLSKASKQWDPKFSNLKKPVIGLLVGGNTKRQHFGQKMAAKLAAQTADLVNKLEGSLIITTSPRTGNEIEFILDYLLEKKIKPSFLHRWQPNELATENPYLGILAHADHIIVTGDSTSMCSEVCGAGKTVHIFAPDGFVIQKHKYFIDELIEVGYANLLGYSGKKYSDARSLKKLDTARDIAEAIKVLILS
jgi:hypothetical protein